MSTETLKPEIVSAIWRVVDRSDSIVSATIAGSFSSGPGLEGISDIDTILIVEELDEDRFERLQADFRTELEPQLSPAGFSLRINATLGPLKFNDPRTAVLHLMIYDRLGHREHVIKSPFTCLDWQRSPLWRKLPMQEVYPVFGLQPHHFISARRGPRDYLGDLLAEQITFRELQFEQGRHREVICRKPMTSRDRHEFAFHVMRFLMQNFLKLVSRENASSDGDELLDTYFEIFPREAETFRPFYKDLDRRKHDLESSDDVTGLTQTTTDFVEAFESQFREAFEDEAVQHLVFRHAATADNRGEGLDAVFLGRSDPDLSELPERPFPELERLAAAVEPGSFRKAFVSPLKRTTSSFRLLAERLPDIPAPVADDRLLEIDYGACDGLTVRECREQFPDLFAAWDRDEDPEFPGGGENSGAVWQRVRDFGESHWGYDREPSVTCTHNGVLRALVGSLLSLPSSEWYRLRIDHLAPITIVSTRRFGQFVDLNEDVEQEMFAGFFQPSRIA